MARVGLALFPCWALLVTQVWAGPVVLVTDVAGKVSLGGGAQVHLMDGLEAQKTLLLGPRARLALLDLATGVERVFLGPCRFSLDARGLPVGARPSAVRPVATAQGPLRLKAESLMPAGVLMRGPEAGLDGARLEVALCGPVVLDDQPELVWKDPGPGARVRFRLYDDNGAILQETTPVGASVRLAPLAPGKPHTWVLEASLPGHPPRTASGCIRSLDQAARIQLDRVRPSAQAGFSERLVFAALLEDLGVRDEARGLWQALAKERPGDQRLRALAGH